MDKDNSNRNRNRNRYGSGNANQKPKTARPKSAKGRFSAVDVAIVILVIASLVGTVIGWIYEAGQQKTKLENDDRFFVSFRMEDVHREVWNGLSVGEKLYFVDDDTFLGYLRDDWAITATLGDETEERISCTGSMVCVGEMPSRTLVLGTDGRRLTPGQILEIRTESEILTVQILEIRQVG